MIVCIFKISSSQKLQMSDKGLQSGILGYLDELDASRSPGQKQKPHLRGLDPLDK